MYDFNIYVEGSIAQVTPQTPEAKEWADEHLPVDGWQKMGAAICVDFRAIEDITHGILDDGLTIEKDNCEVFAGDNGDLCLRAA